MFKRNFEKIEVIFKHQFENFIKLDRNLENNLKLKEFFKINAKLTEKFKVLKNIRKILSNF